MANGEWPRRRQAARRGPLAYLEMGPSLAHAILAKKVSNSLLLSKAIPAHAEASPSRIPPAPSCRTISIPRAPLHTKARLVAACQQNSCLSPTCCPQYCADHHPNWSLAKSHTAARVSPRHPRYVLRLAPLAPAHREAVEEVRECGLLTSSLL